MKIYLLTLNGVFDTGLAALQDTFAIASELRGGEAYSSSELATRRVGLGGDVHTASGLSVPTTVAHGLPSPDIAIVPAIGVKTPAALDAALRHAAIEEAGELLRKWRADGAMIAAACTGTFILAEAGLLTGKRSTTSWWLGEYFKSRYPDVNLDDRRMIVTADNIVTAGATLAHFDLALFLIRRSSPALSALVAQYLITDPRSHQPTYIIPDQMRRSDPVVEKFDHWARTNLARGFSVRSAAEAIGTSPRTLARKVRDVIGKTPLNYIHDLRIERAVYLLQMTKCGIDDIAEQVGYADGVALRELLRKKLGRSASEIRNSLL